MDKKGCTWSKSSGNTNNLKVINWEVFSWLIGGLIKDQEEKPALLVQDKMWLGLAFTTIYCYFLFKLIHFKFQRVTESHKQPCVCYRILTG